MKWYEKLYKITIAEGGIIPLIIIPILAILANTPRGKCFLRLENCPDSPTVKISPTTSSTVPSKNFDFYNYKYNFTNTVENTGNIDPSGYPICHWKVYIANSPDELQYIKTVTYDLNKYININEGFKKGINVERDVANKFALERDGWGHFTISITIKFTDDTQKTIDYPLQYWENCHRLK